MKRVHPPHMPVVSNPTRRVRKAVHLPWPVVLAVPGTAEETMICQRTLVAWMPRGIGETRSWPRTRPTTTNDDGFPPMARVTASSPIYLGSRPRAQPRQPAFAARASPGHVLLSQYTAISNLPIYNRHAALIVHTLYVRTEIAPHPARGPAATPRVYLYNVALFKMGPCSSPFPHQ